VWGECRAHPVGFIYLAHVQTESSFHHFASVHQCMEGGEVWDHCPLSFCAIFSTPGQYIYVSLTCLHFSSNSSSYIHFLVFSRKDFWR
jgi:hypothetical protein